MADVCDKAGDTAAAAPGPHCSSSVLSAGRGAWVAPFLFSSFSLPIVTAIALMSYLPMVPVQTLKQLCPWSE